MKWHCHAAFSAKVIRAGQSMCRANWWIFLYQKGFLGWGSAAEAFVHRGAKKWVENGVGVQNITIFVPRYVATCAA